MSIVYNKFNRGEIDDLALARDDVTRISNSGSYMLNWLPRRLGPMSYRPGLGHLLEAASTSELMIPFTRDINDSAILEMTNESMRIIVDDAAVTRTAVTTTLTNSTFDSDISSWTDFSGAGSTTAWVGGGYAKLTGAGTTSAILYQTSAATDIGEEHGLRIVIERAPVKVQIGSSGVSSEDIFSKLLDPGEYSLAFTPSAAFTVTVSNDAKYAAYVSEVSIEGAGEVSIPHRVPTASLESIRHRQSADVIFCSWDDGIQFKIMRYGVKSWGVVDFRTDNGPFGVINITNITLTPAALSGDTTLTASKSYFKSNDVGRLFKLASDGQTVTASVTAENTGTTGIFVSGLGALRPNEHFPNLQYLQKKSRKFTYSISGIAGGSVVFLQSSLDNVTWSDVKKFTADDTNVYDDQLDNQDIYYRLWVKTGGYGLGTQVLTLTYVSGSISGIARVTEYTSSTVVNVQVVSDFGSTSATSNFYAGQWGGDNGYPGVLNLYEGRLWFAGPDVWGSESDEYQSFDRTITGDSASIYRSVGFGPVPKPYWLMDSSRLMMGIMSDEISIRSDSFGAILTPFNVNIKPGTNQGAANVDAIRIDDKIYFVQRSGTKIYELLYDMNNDRTTPADLMTLNESICSEGVKRIVFTRQPETRVWVLTNSGNIRIYTFDRAEEVAAWSRIETYGDHTFDDICVLPAATEDRVYVTTTRSTGRYIEKLALMSEAQGGSTSKHFDSFIVKTSPGTTITGLDHLEGETVYVWADGQQRGTTYIVSSGQITVSDAWTNVVIGLRYNADWTSNKLLDYTTPDNSKNRVGVTDKSRVTHIGIIARLLWRNGLSYGPDFDNLDPLPDIEDGTTAVTTSVQSYDTVPFEFDGTYSTDSRICIRAVAPATIMALKYNVMEGVVTR